MEPEWNLIGAVMEHEWYTRKSHWIHAEDSGDDVFLLDCDLHASRVARLCVNCKGW